MLKRAHAHHVIKHNTHTPTHKRTRTHAHTQTHAQTHTDRHTQRHTLNVFSDINRCFFFFFDAPENVICTKSLFPNVRRRSTRKGERGRCAMDAQRGLKTPFGASDGVIHSRIFILRVEPSSVRKDILHIPPYQLNLRHLSSTAAVSTQNLDLSGFLPQPGFPGSCGVPG